MPSLLDYSVAQELFNSLSPEEKAWLDRTIPMFSSPPGKIIYDPTSPREGLFLIKEGLVSLFYLSWEGKRLDFCYLGPGDLFGEMPLLGQRMGSAYAESLTESVLCLLDQTHLESLFTAHPRVAFALLPRLQKFNTEARLLVEELAFKGVEARLASFLLRHRDHLFLLDGITQEQLAEKIGASRETVTRALKSLERKGLVCVGRKHITVLDWEGLRSIAEK